MKSSVEELSSVQRRITVEIPAAEVSKTLDKLYKALKSQARLKGFRPGKVPRSVLEKYYGERMSAQAAEEMITAAYPKALEEAEVQPVAQPELDHELPRAGEDFVFKITLDVRPEFELDPESYKGLELKEPKLEVTDEVIGERLDELRDRQAVLTPVKEDRPAAIGDVVVVDYQSFDGDEPVEGGQAENVELELGSGKVQQEIEVALVKAKVGDEVQAVVSYDDQAGNPKLAGKDIRFEIKVTALKEKVLPELDDEFALSLGPDFESLDALKERIKNDVESFYQQQRDAALRTQILDQVRELGDFELPTSLVENEVDAMVEDFKNRLQGSGLDPDQANLDDAKIREDFRPQAEKKVRAGIVLGRIAEMEGVEVTDEDIDAHLEKLSERTGQPAEIIKQIYIKNNMMEDLRAQVLEENTLQAIKAGATIEQVDPADIAPQSPADGGDESDQDQPEDEES